MRPPKLEHKITKWVSRSKVMSARYDRDVFEAYHYSKGKRTSYGFYFCKIIATMAANQLAEISDKRIVRATNALRLANKYGRSNSSTPS